MKKKISQIIVKKKNLKYIHNEINKIKNDKQLKSKLKKINNYNKVQKFKMIIKKRLNIFVKKN